MLWRLRLWSLDASKRFCNDGLLGSDPALRICQTLDQSLQKINAKPVDCIGTDAEWRNICTCLRRQPGAIRREHMALQLEDRSWEHRIIVCHRLHPHRLDPNWKHATRDFLNLSVGLMTCLHELSLVSDFIYGGVGGFPATKVHAQTPSVEKSRWPQIRQPT